MDALGEHGFAVSPGDMGENITTRGIGLLALPEGTELALGDTARIRITGLRNPCKQLNGHAPGLMNAVLDRDADGVLVRKAGIMAVVLEGGEVRPGDAIAVHMPEGERRRLQSV
ncbi:MOSC domain-containing protein [Parasphingopyxis sp.]|uniref:MOSC domain-containing protein n=1 Tax=Parasphingopyxis sp. TaxID=1920299 RepID=UPI003F9EFA51